MTNPNAVPLLPCPFCGPDQSVVDVYEGDVRPAWRVGCGRCGSHSGHCWEKDQAVSLWNNRYPVTPRITREALRAEWNRVAASDVFPAPADWDVEHAIAALKRLGVPVGE